MNLRVLVACLVVWTLVIAPRPGETQPAGRVVRIGILSAATTPPPGSSSVIIESVRGRLRELGYVEGKTLLIDMRWAGGNYDRLPQLMRELIRDRPDVIFLIGSKTAQVGLDATKTIPLVAITCEPFPIVEALARHGRNLTGVTCMTSETVAKRLELLKEAVPKTARVAFLYNPLDGDAGLKAAKATAAALKLVLIPVAVRAVQDFEPALETMRRERADGVLVHPDLLIAPRRHLIAQFALQHRLPAIDPFREFPEVGGLMSYGSSLTETSGRAVELADRLVKGARVADLPIEQAARFYLTINVRTAKALGVTIPPSVLLRADRVIE